MRKKINQNANNERSVFTSNRDGWNFLRTRTTPSKKERLDRAYKKHKKKHY